MQNSTLSHICTTDNMNLAIYHRLTQSIRLLPRDGLTMAENSDKFEINKGFTYTIYL